MYLLHFSHTAFLDTSNCKVKTKNGEKKKEQDFSHSADAFTLNDFIYVIKFYKSVCYIWDEEKG